MSSSLTADEEAGFARFEDDATAKTVPAATATQPATAAHPSIVTLHPHEHANAPAFVPDPITSALGGLNLSSLNAAPASHSDALHQLDLAKRYIARSQAWHSAKRARFASRSNSKLGHAKSFNKQAGVAAAAGGKGGFAREDSLLPYGSADEWEDGSEYTDDSGSDDDRAMELESSPTTDDLQAHLHGPVPEMTPDDYYGE